MVDEIIIEGPDMDEDGEPDWKASFPLTKDAAIIVGIIIAIIAGTKAAGLW